jgi:putative MATE family efflux protein
MSIIIIIFRNSKFILSGGYMSNKTIDKHEMSKTTLKLALPAITEMMLQTLMGVADTAMVGTLGGIAIAAVSISDNPMMVMMAFFAAISVGATALIARFIGARDYRQAEETIKQSLNISLMSSIAFTILMLMLTKKIVVWMGAEADVVAPASDYLFIALLGLPGLIITMIMSGVLRGAGDTKSPMIVNGFSNIVNIVGNFFLIFPSRDILLDIPMINQAIILHIPGAGWEVSGAAIATTFSRLLAAVLILHLIFKKNGAYNIKLTKKINLNYPIIKRIFKIGFPAAAEQMLLRLAQLTFFRIVAELGTVMIAAHKITMTAESISFMPGWGFSLAATTLVGQYLGSEEPEKAKEGCFTAAKMAIGVMTFFGILFFFFPRSFILLFTRDEEIIRYASTCLRIIAFSQPFLAATMVFSGGLRGAGDTRTVLWITTLGSWVIRVTLGYVLTFTLGYGLAGAWSAMLIDFCFRGLLFFYIFNKGKWKHIEV